MEVMEDNLVNGDPFGVDLIILILTAETTTGARRKMHMLCICIHSSLPMQVNKAFKRNKDRKFFTIDFCLETTANKVY